MLTSAIRKWKLLKLKMRAHVLQAECDHAEGLMYDHRRRYANSLRELRSVKNRIVALEEPATLIREAV